MPFSALQGLLGLQGGAQGLSQGMQPFIQRLDAHDAERKASEQRRQQTALQLLMAGWRPTPTAANHPNAMGSFAHGNGAVDVLNDLRAPQGAVQRTGGDGYHVSQDTANSTPEPYAQPETIDVPELGSYQRTPQAALRDLLAIQGPQATIRHLNAESRRLEAPRPEMPQTVSPGEGVYDPRTGKYNVPIPAAAPKPEHVDLVPTEVPDGQGGTKTVWGPKVAGAAIPDKDAQTPALMIATMNRLGLAEGDISAAIVRMDQRENDPAFRAKMTKYQQALAAGSQATPDPHPHGVLGALNNMGGQYLAGMAQENVDPDIRTYQRDAQIVGTAATEILPRPNQQLLATERGLSGIDVGWNPELILDVQSRRHRMRDMLRASLQSTPLGNPVLPTPQGAPPGAQRPSIESLLGQP